MPDKVLPGDETVVVIPATEVLGVPYAIGPAGLSPFDNIALATLNYWQNITKPSQAGAAQGGNISCAIKDDLDLGLEDSDTDGDRTICSRGQSEDLTFYNFSASFNFFRDEDRAGDGVYNLARDLTRVPDIKYLVVHRIGVAPTEPFVTARDQIDTYYAWTGMPIPGFGDGANQTIGNSFVPKNIVDIARKI